MQWLNYAGRALAATLLTSACGTALAQGGKPAPGVAQPQPGHWTAVDAKTLDVMRGGFELPSGLNLSLGIERVVSVNGEVMSRTNVAISDLATANPNQLLQAREALGSARLIQLGNNNFAAPDSGLGSGATLVQNSLDHQNILARTTITSTVNSMSLIKDINFQSTIRDAIVRSAGNL